MLHFIRAARDPWVCSFPDPQRVHARMAIMSIVARLSEDLYVEYGKWQRGLSVDYAFDA
jgi:hypothetical protein